MYICQSQLLRPCKVNLGLSLELIPFHLYLASIGCYLSILLFNPNSLFGGLLFQEPCLFLRQKPKPPEIKALRKKSKKLKLKKAKYMVLKFMENFLNTSHRSYTSTITCSVNKSFLHFPWHLNWKTASRSLFSKASKPLVQVWVFKRPLKVDFTQHWSFTDDVLS